MTLKYDDAQCNKFVRDMEKAGREVQHYRGRWFWEGPAVRCTYSERDDIARETRVKLQQDQLGLGLIVYPVASGKLVGSKPRHHGT